MRVKLELDDLQDVEQHCPDHTAKPGATENTAGFRQLMLRHLGPEQREVKDQQASTHDSRIIRSNAQPGFI